MRPQTDKYCGLRNICSATTMSAIFIHVCGPSTGGTAAEISQAVRARLQPPWIMALHPFINTRPYDMPERLPAIVDCDNISSVLGILMSVCRDPAQ
jgi:hypothetical protein